MRARATLGVLVLVIMTAGACSSKKDNATVATTSTSSTTAVAATPTTAGAPTPSTGAGAGATSVESASSQLFEAWKAGDKAKAKQVANDAAVNELFSHPYTGPSPTFEGCESDSGKAVCSYSYEGGGMFFTVEGSAAAGYRVTSVDYIAD